jgi:hypothetical protein
MCLRLALANGAGAVAPTGPEPFDKNLAKNI